MLKYEHLESTKYWQAKADAEVIALRKERDRDAIRSFVLFLGFFVALIGFSFALQGGLFADFNTGQFIDKAEWLVSRWFG